jgi:DNA-binding response OmpR family regulator
MIIGSLPHQITATLRDATIEKEEIMPNHQSVLVVEDEDLIRELSAEVLVDAGFDVVVVDDGDAALEALGGSADPFCALYTDVNLGPGPDGWAVARRGRELNNVLPVVYVTAASSHEWKANGVPNSILLAKPCTPDQIVEAVTVVLKTTDKPAT